MRTVAPLMLAVAIVVAGPAIAKDKKPVDPNKKICRQVGSTGSLMPKSTCHTKAEWDAIDIANSENAHNVRDPMSSASNHGSGM